MKQSFLLPLFFITILFITFFSFFSGARADTISFDNPITSQKSLLDLIRSVVNQLQPFALVVVALLIIYYGFRYVMIMTAGESGRLKELKESAFKLLIGAVLVAGASAIIEAIKLFAKGLNR